MSSCTSCSKELIDGAKFCKCCGSNQSQPKTEVAQSIILSCSACGTPLVAGAKFCRSCGTAASLPEISKVTAELSVCEPLASQAATKRTSSITPEPIPEEVKAQATKTIMWVVIAAIIGIVLGIGGYYGWKSSQGENISAVKQPILENTDATAKVQAWLQSLPLQYHSKDNCYVVQVQTPNGSANYCDKLVETLEVKDGTNTFIYASLSGSYLNDDGTLGGSHADSGVLEFIKFKVQKNKAVPLSSSGDILSGGYGTPGFSRIISLGKNNQIGWAIEDGWVGMGEASSYFRLYAPLVNTDTGVKEIFGIQTMYDTVNTCSDDDKNCISKEISTVVRQTINDDAYYPLKISTSIKQGAKSNKTSSSKDLVITFDKKRNSYQVPAAYKDVFK